MLKKIITTTLILLPVLASAEFTASKKIGLVDIDENQNVFVVPSTPGGWGAPSCPSHYFVKITASSPAYKDMLATILTAKAADLEVKISGTCGTAPFFEVNKIRLN